MKQKNCTLLVILATSCKYITRTRTAFLQQFKTSDKHVFDCSQITTKSGYLSDKNRFKVHVEFSNMYGMK